LSSICHKGGSRCCSLHVSLITPDVFFIAENLTKNLSESKLFFIIKRLKLRADKVEEYIDDSYRMECVFLGKSSGQCVIYNYRPEACRRFFTNDEKDCIESNGSPLQDGAVFYSTGILSSYMALAAHNNDLFIDSHEMSKSLYIALDNPLLFKKWLRGEPNVFPGVKWEGFHQEIKKMNADMKIKIK
ncbi:YkgJ family cysteine cluster protein, partial [Salmonella enterica]|nr:YkgJ family cysteine cluster protein [Salmonella enterica]